MNDIMEKLWMTAATVQRLEKELAELTEPSRQRDTAQEARVLELRDMLRRAEVSTKPDDGIVEPGMRVRVRFDSDGSEEVFLLGSRTIVGDAEADLDVVSPTSPLGSAVSGRSVGESASFTAPNGATITVTICEAVPFAS